MLYFLFLNPISSALISCGLPPDQKCIINASRYVVSGQILSTNLHTGNTNNYEAKMQINCVWATKNPFTSQDVLLKTVTVTGFSQTNPDCRNLATNTAKEGDKQIYFITADPSNAMRENQILYTVVNTCLGNMEDNEASRLTLATALEGYPEYKVSSQSDACTLPNPSNRNMSGITTTFHSETTPSNKPAPNAPNSSLQSLSHWTSVLLTVFFMLFLTFLY